MNFSEHAHVTECGRPRSYYDNRRIVNGLQVRPHEYPWMALLLSKNKAVCGGSIINDYYILTAGHCKEQELALFFSLT